MNQKHMEKHKRLIYPLDTDNASTFIKFTTIQHSKIVRGFSAGGQDAIDKVVDELTIEKTTGEATGAAGIALGKAVDMTTDLLSSGAKALYNFVAPDEFIRGQQATYGAIKEGDGMNIARGRTVEIFMPQSIQINDSASYDNTSLGGAGRLIGAATSNRKIPGMAEAAFAAGSGVGSIQNLFKEGIEGMSSSQIAAVANKIPGGSELRAAASSGFGVVLDPVTITTFTGVPIRQFSFTYKLIPSSESESRMIGDIIKFFRTELYPERSGWALKYPNAFEIEQVYMPGAGRRPTILNKFLKSFLVSISSTYNPTSNAMMVDGSWSEIDLTLTFQEERSLTKQDIHDGGL